MPIQDLTGSVVGVTLLKINGIFDLDCKNARWQIDQPVAAHATGAGWKQARGIRKCSITFEAVIPRTQNFDYLSLVNFSAEVYDKETRKIVVFAGSGFDWTGNSGSSDVGSAMSSKTITAIGTTVIEG